MAQKLIEKRIIKLSKIAHQTLKKHPTMRAFAGAWLDKDGRQCITNGYWATRYNTPTNGVIEAPTTDGNLCANQFFQDSLSKPPAHIQLDLKEIKQLYTTAKKELDGLFISEIHGAKFDTKLLLEVFNTITNPNFCTFPYILNTRVLYAKGDNGEAILLPLRFSENMPVIFRGGQNEIL